MCHIIEDKDAHFTVTVTKGTLSTAVSSALFQEFLCGFPKNSLSKSIGCVRKNDLEK